MAAPAVLARAALGSAGPISNASRSFSRTVGNARDRFRLAGDAPMALCRTALAAAKSPLVCRSGVGRTAGERQSVGRSASRSACWQSSWQALVVCRSSNQVPSACTTAMSRIAALVMPTSHRRRRLGSRAHSGPWSRNARTAAAGRIVSKLLGWRSHRRVPVHNTLFAAHHQGRLA